MEVQCLTCLELSCVVTLSALVRGKATMTREMLMQLLFVWHRAGIIEPFICCGVGGSGVF